MAALGGAAMYDVTVTVRNTLKLEGRPHNDSHSEPFSHSPDKMSIHGEAVRLFSASGSSEKMIAAAFSGHWPTPVAVPSSSAVPIETNFSVQPQPPKPNSERGQPRSRILSAYLKKLSMTILTGGKGDSTPHFGVSSQKRRKSRLAAVQV